MSTPSRRMPSRASASESPDPEIARVKDELRARVRAERAARPLAAAEARARLGRALAVSEGHARVALYASVPPEPDTWGLIDALSGRGVRLLLPVLAGRRTPAWAWYEGPDALRPGWHGIHEPTGRPLGPEALAQADLVWCPALAVSPDGRRVGTGGGWYDRALTRKRPGVPVAALVNDREVVDGVPAHAWDRPVDIIVTEHGTRWTAE